MYSRLHNLQKHIILYKYYMKTNLGKLITVLLIFCQLKFKNKIYKGYFLPFLLTMGFL